MGNHLDVVKKQLHSIHKISNYIVFEDFNKEFTENTKTNLTLCNLKNTLKGPICFKNHEKGSTDKQLDKQLDRETDLRNLSA